MCVQFPCILRACFADGTPDTWWRAASKPTRGVRQTKRRVQRPHVRDAHLSPPCLAAFSRKRGGEHWRAVCAHRRAHFQALLDGLLDAALRAGVPADTCLRIWRGLAVNAGAQISCARRASRQLVKQKPKRRRLCPGPSVQRRARLRPGIRKHGPVNIGRPVRCLIARNPGVQARRRAGAQACIRGREARRAGGRGYR